MPFFLKKIFFTVVQRSAGCPDCHRFITKFPRVIVFKGDLSGGSGTAELSFHLTERRGVRQQVWGAPTKGPGQDSRPEPPSRPLPVGDGGEGDGRPQPELRKRRKGREAESVLGEAGSRRGRSPGHHTHPARSPRRFCPGPAASRALPAPLTERSRKPALRSCPPPLAFSRPLSSSHLPVPQEEQDASSP